jgi:hypothetical protein
VSLLSSIFIRNLFLLNKLRFLNIFFWVLFSANSTVAKSELFIVEKLNISLDMPQGWQGLRGYLGRDITLLGLELGTRRVTDRKRLDLKAEKKASKKFKNIKIEWLKNKAATLKNISLDKPISFLNKKHLYHEVSYLLAGNSFVEGNLFLECGPDAGLNVSFLTLEEKKKAFQKNLKEVLTSLKCLKK